MQKNINSSSFTEMSSKNNDMPPPYPPNKSLIGGISSSFNTYLSYKSLNLSKSPIKTNTKILSEELSQTNSYKNSSYSNYYNHINNFNFLYSRKNSEINKNENLSNIYNDDKLPACTFPKTKGTLLYRSVPCGCLPRNLGRYAQSVWRYQCRAYLC